MDMGIGMERVRIYFSNSTFTLLRYDPAIFASSIAISPSKRPYDMWFLGASDGVRSVCLHVTGSHGRGRVPSSVA